MFRYAWRITGLAVVMLVVASFCALHVHAQALSEFDWRSFEQEGGEEEVQTHTDPFSSGVASVEDLTVEDLQLTGIVFNTSEDAFALISGYLVRPGDLIAGYRVDSVEKDRVRLKRVDDVFVLVLGGGI